MITIKDILKTNFGKGDAADFVCEMGNFGTEIEDGIMTEAAYEEWLDKMEEWFDGIIIGVEI